MAAHVRGTPRRFQFTGAIVVVGVVLILQSGSLDR